MFAETHVEIRRWFDEGLVDGLRVDHPDGLRDPEGYLTDLSELTGGAYVLVEKILEPGEDLDQAWSCEGTTGYDALAFIDRVLTDPAGEAPLGALEPGCGAARSTGTSWSTTASGPSPTGCCTPRCGGSCGTAVARWSRDTRDARSTTTAWRGRRRRAAGLLPGLPLLPPPRRRAPRRGVRPGAGGTDPTSTRRTTCSLPVLHDPTADAALRFQQTSGMVMAKGVEDYAFYR